MTPREHVFIIEDDQHISQLVKYNLQRNGFDSFVYHSGEEALRAADRKFPAMFIVDIMLPGIDGLEVCRRLRQTDRTKNIPVLILTAKGEEVDRIVGLELGADDYMVKPFSPRELVLRVKAILKRGKDATEIRKDILKAEDITVDVLKHEVRVQTKKIDLTPMEFKLLQTLIERSGRVQSRENLLNDVWGFEEAVNTRTVDTHIKRLREKLGKAGRFIETVSGIGYRFKDDED